MGICDSEWVFEYSSNRAPDIDDLVSTFGKLGSIFWQVIGNTVLGGLVGLVDVYTLDRPTGFGTA